MSLSDCLFLLSSRIIISLNYVTGETNTEREVVTVRLMSVCGSVREVTGPSPLIVYDKCNICNN